MRLSNAFENQFEMINLGVHKQKINPKNTLQ